jgi:hypothetical protein
MTITLWTAVYKDPIGPYPATVTREHVPHVGPMTVGRVDGWRR